MIVFVERGVEMSGKGTYLLTGTERHRAGQGLYHEINEHLWSEGFKTLRHEVRSTYAESFARAVGDIREELSELSLLIYLAVPSCASSHPESTARDFSGEFNRELLGLVNGCMELRSVFSKGAQVVLVTVRPESYSSVHRAVTRMVPAVLGLINETPTLECLQLIHFELVGYSMGYRSGNLPELLNQIVELAKPTQASQDGVVTA